VVTRQGAHLGERALGGGGGDDLVGVAGVDVERNFALAVINVTPVALTMRSSTVRWVSATRLFNTFRLPAWGWWSNQRTRRMDRRYSDPPLGQASITIERIRVNSCPRPWSQCRLQARDR
jgi:hypothetical protein